MRNYFTEIGRWRFSPNKSDIIHHLSSTVFTALALVLFITQPVARPLILLSSPIQLSLDPSPSLCGRETF